jgi:hypothetical protein
MVDAAPASISGSLIIDVETSRPHGEKDIPRTSQLIVEENFGAHILAPPSDGRVDVAGKNMSAMEIE